MKQLYRTAGYHTFDLTECKLHRIGKDGEEVFVLSYPKKWESSEPMELMTVEGPKEFRSYKVTEWEEVELQPKGE